MAIARNKRIPWKLCSILTLFWIPQTLAQCPFPGDNLIVIKLDRNGQRKQVVDVGSAIRWVLDRDGITPIPVYIQPTDRPLCQDNNQNPCVVNTLSKLPAEYTYTYCSDPTVAPPACTPTPSAPHAVPITHHIRVRSDQGYPRRFPLGHVTLALDDQTHTGEVNHVIRFDESTCIRWRLFTTNDDGTDIGGIDADIKFPNPVSGDVLPTTKTKPNYSLWALQIAAEDQHAVDGSMRNVGDAKYSVCQPNGSNCVDPTIHILGSGHLTLLDYLRRYFPFLIIALVSFLFGIPAGTYLHKRRTRKS